MVVVYHVIGWGRVSADSGNEFLRIYVLGMF
jgi:hypothetical protein